MAALAGARHLAGCAAIVTGASRGIGLAIAQRLADEGARVCVTARDEGNLEAAVSALGGPDRALGVPGKAHDLAHAADAVERTLEAWGRIDLLVNNAGINPAYGSLVDLDLGIARKILDVNVMAALAWTQAVHRAWMAEHGGAVVNVASVAGLRAARGIGFYGISKAAMIHMTGQLAAELAPAVRVNAVAPAIVKTRFAERLYAGREGEVVAAYPLGRLGEPADVAGAVAFLASPDAAWITGHTVTIDGGLILGGGV